MIEFDEHDITKKMLNVIRENFGKVNKNLVIVEAIGGDDVIEVSGKDRSDEEQNIRDIVDTSTVINVFNIYPKAKNVVFGGVIRGIGGIEFQMTLEDENGLYITGNNIQITSETVRKLNLLKGYYDRFRDTWFKKLTTEYNDVD